MVPIGTRFCPPDLGTKAHASTRCLLLSYMIGVCDGEGLPIGEKEFFAAWKDETLKKAFARQVCKVNKQHALRQVLALSLLEVSQASSTNSSATSSTWTLTTVVMDFFADYVNLLNFVVLFGLMVVVVAYAVPRWSRRKKNNNSRESEAEDVEDLGQSISRTEIRDRLHDWLEESVIPAITGSQKPASQAGSSSDAGASSSSGAARTTRALGSAEALLQPTATYTGQSLQITTVTKTEKPGQAQRDGVASGQVRPGDVGPVQQDQMPVVPSRVYLIGEARGGKSYHREFCGMVKQRRSDYPNDVKVVERSYAASRGLRPCRQCNP